MVAVQPTYWLAADSGTTVAAPGKFAKTTTQTCQAQRSLSIDHFTKKPKMTRYDARGSGNGNRKQNVLTIQIVKNLLE